MEANPYQTKKQRREGEVKALLEKVPAELISLNQDQIAEIDVDALEVSWNSNKLIFEAKYFRHADKAINWIIPLKIVIAGKDSWAQ